MIEVTGNKFKLGEPVGVEPLRKVGQVVCIGIHKYGGNANYLVEWINNDLTFQTRWLSEDDLLDIRKKEEPAAQESPAGEVQQQNDPSVGAHDNAPQPEEAAAQ